MLVIDTNILVSFALMPDGNLGKKLTALIDKKPYAFREATFVELTDVLMRPKFDRFTTAQARGGVLKIIASSAECFEPTETIADCRDPKDNMFLETAIAANATHIITGDDDLLVLSPWRGIEIVRISDF